MKKAELLEVILKLQEERDDLRGALVGIVGASDPAELKDMKVALTLLIPSDESGGVRRALEALECLLRYPK